MTCTFEDHAVIPLAPPENRSRNVSKATQKWYVGAKVNLK
jgi:hypothetical protein